MMTESPDSESPDQTRRRLKKLKDNLVPPTIGGSIGVGCAIAITLPGAYSTFQGVFSNGFGWGIAALCLLGGVVGGLAKAIAMRFGLPGMNQVTPIVGVASGMAIMVGTGIASVVYRSIIEFTGWGIHTIAALVIGTSLMCLFGSLVGCSANMFWKAIQSIKIQL